MNSPRIPDSKLEADLHRLADELDRIPRARDVKRDGEHAYSTYLDRYGSIENALEAAGFPAHSRVHCGPGDIGTEALLDDLRRLGEELGRPPKTSDVEAAGEFSLPTYYNYFDSLGDALSQAGFPAEEGNTIPRELLVDALQNLADELGRPPTSTEIIDHCDYHVSTYRNRFGSQEEALEAAGLLDNTPDSDRS